MTPKQRQALNFIRAHFDHYGYAPSYKEISVAIKNKSKSRVNDLLKALEEQGQIVRTERRVRNIELTGRRADVLQDKLERIKALCLERDVVPTWFGRRVLAIIRGNKPRSNDSLNPHGYTDPANSGATKGQVHETR